MRALILKAGARGSGSRPGSFAIRTAAKLSSLGLGKHLQRDFVWVVRSVRQETGPHTWKTCTVDVLEIMRSQVLPCLQSEPNLYRSLVCSEKCDKISNTSCCMFCFRLIFFGGYGYFPEGKQRGTFEFDETSFWVGKLFSP